MSAAPESPAAPTRLQRALRRRADRKRWGMLALAVAGLASWWVAAGALEQHRAPAADAPASTPAAPPADKPAEAAAA